MRISKAVKANWAEVLENAVPPTVVTTDGNWTVPSEYGFVRVIYKQEGLPEDYELVVGGYASPQVIDREKHLITKEAMAADLPRFLAHPKFRNAMIIHSNIQVGEVLPKWCHPETGECYETKVDDIGLFCLVKVRTDKYRPEICEKVEADVRAGRLAAFSISGDAPFDSRRHVCHDGTCFWIIDKIIFYEITVCQLGVNQDAKFSILSKMAHCTGGACPIDLPASLSAASLFRAQAGHVHKQAGGVGTPKKPSAPTEPTRPDPSRADVGQRAGAATGAGSIPTAELETKQEGEVREGVEKARRYISDPGEAPKGAKPERGPRGGWYYESEGAGEKPSEEPPSAEGPAEESPAVAREISRMREKLGDTERELEYWQGRVKELQQTRGFHDNFTKEARRRKDAVYMRRHNLTQRIENWQGLQVHPNELKKPLEAAGLQRARWVVSRQIRGYGHYTSGYTVEVAGGKLVVSFRSGNITTREQDENRSAKLEQILSGAGFEVTDIGGGQVEVAGRSGREEKQQFAPGGSSGGGASPGDVAGGWASQVRDPTDIRHRGGGVMVPERKCAHGVLFRGDQTFGPPEMEYGEPDDKEDKLAPPTVGYPRLPRQATLQRPKPIKPAGTLVRSLDKDEDDPSGLDQDDVWPPDEHPEVMGEQTRRWLQHEEGAGYQLTSPVGRGNNEAGGAESEAYYLNKHESPEEHAHAPDFEWAPGVNKSCPLCAAQATVEAALDSRDLYSAMTPQFRGVLRHCLASLQAGVGSVDWASGAGWVVLSVDHAGSGFMKPGYAVPLGGVMEAVGASAFERGLVGVVQAAVDAGTLLASVHPLTEGEVNKRLTGVVIRLNKAGLAGVAAEALGEGINSLVKRFPSLEDIATWAWTGNPALLKGFRVGWLGDAGRVLRQVTDRLGKLNQKELPDHVRVGVASLLEDLRHLEDSLGVTEELKGQVVGVEEPELNVVREVAKETERDVDDADNKLTAVDPDIEKERTTERFERDNEEDMVHPANVNVMTGAPPGVPTGNPDAVESYRTRDSAISRARDTTFGNVITGRLHQAYSDAADRAFSLGYFKDSEERKKVGKAIGDALKIFEDGLREAGLHDIPVSAEDAARLTKAVRNWPHVEKQTGPDSDLWGAQNRGAGRRALGPTTEELDTTSQGQHPAYGFSRRLRGEPEVAEDEVGKAADVDVAVNRGVATTGSERDPDALVDYSSGPSEPRWPDGDDAGTVHKHEDKEGSTAHHRKLIRRGTKPPRPNMKPCPRCRRNWIHRDTDICADCYREVGPGERPHEAVRKDKPAQWAQDRAVDPSRVSNGPELDVPMRVHGAGEPSPEGYFEDQGPADAEHPQPIREREFDSRGAVRDERHSVPILKMGNEDARALFKLHSSMWSRYVRDKALALAVVRLGEGGEIEVIDVAEREN